MKCAGIRYLNFPDKNDSSKMVKGVNVFGTYPIVKNGSGFGFQKFFLSDWLIENRLNGEIPKVGDEFEVLYNQNGKINDLRIFESNEVK